MWVGGWVGRENYLGGREPGSGKALLKISTSMPIPDPSGEGREADPISLDRYKGNLLGVKS